MHIMWFVAVSSPTVHRGSLSPAVDRQTVDHPNVSILFDIISSDFDARRHWVSQSRRPARRRLKGRSRPVAWNPSAN